MPRNASGTYSLPSGNPVSSGTLIDANWANNTLNDLANEVTDSLSRSAEGGMLAPLRLTDGVQATPSLAFTNEPSSGLYRAGTNDAWFVSGGNQVMQFTSSGVVGRLAAGAVGTPSLTFFGDLNTGLWSPAADTLAASTGGSERLRVDSSGNVGIGTASPGARLDVQAALLDMRCLSTTGTNYVRQRMSNTGGDFYYGIDGSAGANFGVNYGAVLWYTGAYPMVFATNNTERMRLDSSGNLGIGITPRAWGGVYKSLDINGPTALASTASGDTFTQLANGAWFNGTNWIYQYTGISAARYQMTGPAGGANHAWFISPTGTAGNAISFTQAMTLDASGNLGIGTASPVFANGSGIEIERAGAATLRLQDSSTTNSFELYVDSNVHVRGRDSMATIFYTADVERMRITNAGNIVAGASAALATTATNGFLYVPTCAGTPTGTPTAITGMAPIVVNTTNNKLYFYSGGAWRDAGP